MLRYESEHQQNKVYHRYEEVMANRLGTDFDELYALASCGNALSISSMCTVFAESEVISYIGSGEKRENIATGVIDSLAHLADMQVL